MIRFARRTALALAMLLPIAAAPPSRAQPQDSAVGQILRRAGVAPSPGALTGTDPKARAAALDALERGYPLPRNVLDRENSLPPDRDQVMDRLGLVRHADVATTNLTGHTPDRREIVDAFRGR